MSYSLLTFPLKLRNKPLAVGLFYAQVQLITLFAVLCGLGFLVPTSQAQESQKLFVQVQSVKLRSQPKHFATAVADLKYGDSLSLLQKLPSEDSDAAWLKVKTTRGVQGFVHSSAITQREVVLQGSSRRSGVTQDTSDIVLAGKGFNRDVEKQFASRQPGANFAAVDRMERINPSDQEVVSLLRNGKLL